MKVVFAVDTTDWMFPTGPRCPVVVTAAAAAVVVVSGVVVVGAAAAPLSVEIVRYTYSPAASVVRDTRSWKEGDPSRREAVSLPWVTSGSCRIQSEVELEAEPD